MLPFFLYCLIIGLALVPSTSTFAQPYTPSCEIAIDKLSKARQNLEPFQRTMELAKARERGAYADLAVCTGGGIYSARKAAACSEATWKAPERTKEVIQAEDDYRHLLREFERIMGQVNKICFLEP